MLKTFYLGSVYRDALTTAILALKENSKLEEIKTKWWNSNVDKKDCEVLSQAITYVQLKYPTNNYTYTAYSVSCTPHPQATNAATELTYMYSGMPDRKFEGAEICEDAKHFNRKNYSTLKINSIS